MTAIVLPEIDRSTIEDLKRRMPSLRLAEIEIPSMQEVGRSADRAIDRAMGRSRPTIWPWIAAGIGIAAVVGVAAALMTWMRRPGWTTDRGRYGRYGNAGTYGSTADPATYDPTMTNPIGSEFGTGAVTDGGQQ